MQLLRAPTPARRHHNLPLFPVLYPDIGDISTTTGELKPFPASGVLQAFPKNLGMQARRCSPGR